MKDKKCLYCRDRFLASRYHPKQKVCTSPACQRRRRTDYHRGKVCKDTAYREQCRDSQSKWLEKNPTYMKTYMAQRRTRMAGRSPTPAPIQLEELLQLEKNNLAFDLRSYNAKILLLAPNAQFEKNILASAQIIVIQELIAHTTSPKGAKRTSL